MILRSEGGTFAVPLDWTDRASTDGRHLSPTFFEVRALLALVELVAAIEKKSPGGFEK